MKTSYEEFCKEAEEDTFNEDLDRGKAGEIAFEEYAESRGWLLHDYRLKESFQQQDIDYSTVDFEGKFDRFNPGQEIYWECKTDYYLSRLQPTIFYEYLTRHKPGCMSKTNADYIWYYSYNDNTAYVLDVSAMHRAIANVNRERFRAIYVTKSRTWGYVIPIDFLRKTQCLVTVIDLNK